MLRILSFMGLTLCLSACQTSPHYEALEIKNKRLEIELAEARNAIKTLKKEQKSLDRQNNELERVNTILDAEKATRAEESSELRLQVRKFTQRQIDHLKEFLVQRNLLDFVGEEIFERSEQDEEAAILVDLANPIPRSGSLIGVNGEFAEATSFSVNVLRPVSGRYVVIWQSAPLLVDSLGYQRLRFPVSVGVGKGDVIAYDFADRVGVKYDKGTGQTLIAKQSFVLGDLLNVDELKFAEEKRAYSLGVTAILE